MPDQIRIIKDTPAFYTGRRYAVQRWVRVEGQRMPLVVCETGKTVCVDPRNFEPVDG